MPSPVIAGMRYVIIPALIFIVVSHGGTFEDVARACVWVVSYGILVMVFWRDEKPIPEEA